MLFLIRRDEKKNNEGELSIFEIDNLYHIYLLINTVSSLSYL